LERWQLQLRRATLDSSVASPVWPESSPEKHKKTVMAPQLPGAITLPSELRFAQNLYRWKVDVEIFLTICCMTRFEHQKASKIAPKNRVRKRYTHENRGRFGGGAAWWIRTPRGKEHTSRTMVTHCTPRSHARCATPPINKATPPLVQARFARALGHIERSLGEK
jgi:hypothetical protein